MFAGLRLSRQLFLKQASESDILQYVSTQILKYQIIKTSLLRRLRADLSRCHISHDVCHMSYVTRHLSPITYHISCLAYFISHVS